MRREEERRVKGIVGSDGAEEKEMKDIFFIRRTRSSRGLFGDTYV